MSKSGYDQFFKAAQKRTAPQKRKPTANLDQLSTEQVETMLRARAGIKKSQQKNKFPWGLTIVSAIGVVAMALALFNTEEIEAFANRLEFGLTTVRAETKEKTNETSAPQKEEKKTATPVKTEMSEEEIDHLSKLVERKKALDEREQEIARQEQDLGVMKAELEKKMAELEMMRGKITEMLADRVKVDEQKIETLVQMYSNMKPIQAAKVFEALDEDLAIEVLGKMKKKNAADIMNLLKPEKAQIFSERYAGYKSK